MMKVKIKNDKNRLKQNHKYEKLLINKYIYLS